MSDFSISYSMGSPPTSSEADTSLWSFNQVAMHPTAGNAVLLQPRRGGAGTLVQQEVAHALGFCREFRTLDAHLKQILTQIPALREHRTDIAQTLTTLRDNGLFESSESAWQRLTGDVTEPDLTSCGICILTCDRPAALDRLLTQLLSRKLPTDVDQILVVDDSREKKSVERNAAIVEQASCNSDVRVLHLNTDLREQFITHLKNLVPDASESVDWLLSRERWGDQATYGQSRNFALLLNVGRRLLMLDDDILPEAIAPPVSPANLQFATGGQREAVMWTSKAEMAQQTLVLDDSPASLMLGQLGAPLARMMSNSDLNHSSLRGTNGELIAAYHAHSKILISQAGTWGDPGTGDTASWLCFMPETTIKRALTNFADLEAGLGARAGWMGYRGPSLTPYAIMSAHTGIDHSVLLPPYLPVGRNEDILFGVMTQRLHPDSLALNAGWAVRHEPVENRSDRVPLTPLSAGPGLSTLADWLGREPADQWGLTPQRRLQGIADQIWRISEMDEPERESLIRLELASKRASFLRQCMEHMGRFATIEHLPGFPQWKRFIEKSRDTLLGEIENPEQAPLKDWAAQGAGIEVLRNGSSDFAQALTDWPEICQAARKFSLES